jgi:hypothetical protein
MFDELRKYLLVRLQESLVKQKHNASGKLRDSIEVVEQQAVTGLEIVAYAEDYGGYVERGRQAGKLPPISALEQWVKTKGIGSGKEALGIAWAIAKSIEKKGIPSQPYKNWSAGNSLKRTGWVTDALNEDEIFKQINEVFGKEIESKINNIVEKWQ